jgi:CRP/FNR family cyclic AMP-dependent transcriptional regulator
MVASSRALLWGHRDSFFSLAAQRENAVGWRGTTSPLQVSGLIGYRRPASRGAIEDRGDFMQVVKFKAGDRIIYEGDDGDTAFLINSGVVEVSVGGGDKAKVLGRLAAGEVFGEMCLIEPGPRSATVRAVTDTECVMTTYDEFTASMHDKPETAVLFMKTLVRRLRQMNERFAKSDPAKRGIRAMFRDWQKSLEPPEDQEFPTLHWPMML